MQQAGEPQFNYDTFKQAYDTIPALSELTSFGPDGVTIGSDDTKSSSKKSSSDNTVSKMAKSATNLDDL